MFGMSMVEILLILAVALIVLGPEKLPQVARQLGKMVRQVRRAAMDVRSAIDIDDIRQNTPPISGYRPTTVDPYAAAAAEDQDTFGVEHPRETPFEEPPSGDGEDADDESDWHPAMADSDEDPWATGDDDAELVAAFDASIGAGEIQSLSATMTAVPLKPWVSLTGIGVMIEREAMVSPPVSLLATVTAVPVSGGLPRSVPPVDDAEPSPMAQAHIPAEAHAV